MFRRSMLLVAVAAIISLAGFASAADNVLVEVWTNVTGTNIEDFLTGNDLLPAYPRAADMEWHHNVFEIPDGQDKTGTFPGFPNPADNYVGRLVALIVPPQTGDYTFWLSSDDDGRLWLSSDDTPANAVQIAAVDGWLPANGFDPAGGSGGNNNLQSAPITLTGGQKYYIEAAVDEGGGGDHLQVNWAGPGIGSTHVAIAEQYLEKFVRPQDKWASAPDPADGSVVDQTDPILSWTPSGYADSHQIAMGTDYDTVANATSGPATFFPSQQLTSDLIPGKTYYWKIIGIKASDADSPFLGPVWSFTVADNKPIQPNPADGATLQPTALTLSWVAGIGKKYNQIYVGTDYATVEASETPTGSPTADNYAISGLDNSTTVYWRVDNVVAYHWDAGLGQLVIDTKYKGDVWSFTTIPSFPMTDPNLLLRYTFDEDTAPLVFDISGHANHGTIVGDPTWTPNGYYEAGMDFDGNGDGVNSGQTILSGRSKFTMAGWISPRNPTASRIAIVGQNDAVEFGFNGGGFNCWTSGGGSVTMAYSQTNTWVHFAVVGDGTTLDLYLNGVLQASGGTATTNYGSSGYGVNVGGAVWDADGNWLNGTVDDIRIYDYALTAEELALVMRGDPLKAYDPAPGNYATVGVDVAQQISWSAGDMASSHEIYFSTDETAVRSGDPSALLGTQTGTSRAISAVMGQTYFWRIDEHNSDASVTEGSVWRFTVASYRVVDDFESYGDLLDFGVDGQRLWFVWWDGFGYGQPVQKDGNGSGSVVDRSTAIADASTQAMSIGYTGNSWVQAMTADLPISSNWTAYGTEALNLRFRGYRASVGSLTNTGGTGYSQTGSGADIWGNADQFNFAYVVMNGAVNSVQVKINSLVETNVWAKCGVMVRDTLDAGSIFSLCAVTPQSGAAFQWRTDTDGTCTNVNVGAAGAADPPGQLTAPIWLRIERDISGFATGKYSTDGSNWVTISGPNDAQVSTPMYVGVALCSHDAALTSTSTWQDLLINDVAPTSALQDTDIGITSNKAENLYVELSDGTNTKRVLRSDNPNAVLNDTWQDWDIALSEFSPVNTSNVQSITIGVTGELGGDGTIFVDNIRLFRPRYVAGKLTPWIQDIVNDGNGKVDLRDAQAMFADWLQQDAYLTTVAPNSSDLVAHYALDGNANDSSGNGYNGDPCGAPTYVSGVYGSAVHFDGVSDWINVGVTDVNGAEPRTIAGWAKADTTTIPNWTNVFGFTNDGTGGNASRHFDIDRRDYGYYAIHVYGWERDIMPVDLDWHHLAATYDGTTIKWYGDGSLAGSEDRDLDTAGMFHIGKRGDNSNIWPGSVDDVYVYRAALTQEQIGYLAGNGAAQWYAPVLSTANISDNEAEGSKVVDFKDLAVLLDRFGETQVWP